MRSCRARNGCNLRPASVDDAERPCTCQGRFASRYCGRDFVEKPCARLAGEALPNRDDAIASKHASSWWHARALENALALSTRDVYHLSALEPRRRPFCRSITRFAHAFLQDSRSPDARRHLARVMTAAPNPHRARRPVARILAPRRLVVTSRAGRQRLRARLDRIRRRYRFPPLHPRNRDDCVVERAYASPARRNGGDRLYREHAPSGVDDRHTSSGRSARTRSTWCPCSTFVSMIRESVQLTNAFGVEQACHVVDAHSARARLDPTERWPRADCSRQRVSPATTAPLKS